MIPIAVALVRAVTAAVVTGVQYLVNPRPRLWVDDGLCTCLECRCPWLVGDNQPAAEALPPELERIEHELGLSR